MESHLQEYLGKRFTPGTMNRYLFAIQRFIETLGQAEARNANVKALSQYLSDLRAGGMKSDYLQTEFYALKNYFKWLVVTHQITEDPSANIHLNDIRPPDIQFQDLFTPEELEKLLLKPNRYRLLLWRDKIVVSLYIYQGLTTGEIEALTVNDVQLSQQIIFVTSDRNASRILPLNAKQVSYFQRYLTFDRPYLLKSQSEALLIGKLGSPETKDGLHYVIESQRGLFPDRKLNPKTIRQSVIANLLKSGSTLKDTQLFAGHKNISTTERYLEPDISRLTEAVGRFHPLK